MQESLSLLELKVRNILKEKKALKIDLELLSQQIIELKSIINQLEANLLSKQNDCDLYKQDITLANMVVEDLINEIDVDAEFQLSKITTTDTKEIQQSNNTEQSNFEKITLIKELGKEYGE